MKKLRLKSLSSFTATLIMSLFSLVALTSGSAHAQAPAYTCTWTGGGGSNTNFSDANNWTNCNGAPLIGDDDNLIFNNTTLSSEPTINNDLNGLTVTNVSFTGSNSVYSDQIAGNSLTITGGINDSTSGSFPTGFSGTVIVSGNQTFTSSNTNGDTYIGSLQGSGNVVASGGVIAFSDLSSYSGTLSSTSSNIQLQSYTSFTSGGLVSVSGNAALTLDEESARGDNGVFNVPISLGGNGISKIGALNLVGQGNGDSVTLADPVALTSNVQVTADGNTTLSITGVVTYNNHTISSAGQNVTTISVPTGDNESGQSPYIGSNVTYIVDGTVGKTTVTNGGLLKGLGTVGSTTIQTGGSIAPGHSPGCLNVVGFLSLSGTYDVDIQSPGNTACTDYDQLNVNGSTDITGGSLNVIFLNSFTPAVGQTFKVLNNESGTSISGTFNGLPEGAVFADGTTKFRITYLGAGSNSVVLTVVNPNTPVTGNATAPKTPDTGYGASKSDSNPLTLFAGFSFVSVTLYAGARKLKKSKL